MIESLLGAIFGAVVGLAVTLGAVWIVLLRYLGPMTVKPQGSVHTPPDTETELQAKISDSMISRLASDIAESAQVSPERAREEAEKIVKASETWSA